MTTLQRALPLLSKEMHLSPRVLIYSGRDACQYIALYLMPGLDLIAKSQAVHLEKKIALLATHPASLTRC